MSDRENVGRNEHMRALYASGVTVSELATKFHISQSRAWNIVHPERAKEVRNAKQKRRLDMDPDYRAERNKKHRKYMKRRRAQQKG